MSKLGGYGYEQLRYPVNRVYRTIQGEGYQTGVPMVLVRFQGCNVGCPWCDTRETWVAHEGDQVEIHELNDPNRAPYRWAYMSPFDIADVVGEHAYDTAIRWVMLTGGEPALYQLDPVISVLAERGFAVAVETSGTAAGVLSVSDTTCDWLVVSPKVGMPGELPIIREVIAAANEIKWVVGRERDVDRLVEFLASYAPPFEVVVSVQPLSQNPQATALCLDACYEYGWRLSIQTHKYIGVP